MVLIHEFIDDNTNCDKNKNQNLAVQYPNVGSTVTNLSMSYEEALFIHLILIIALDSSRFI